MNTKECSKFKSIVDYVVHNTQNITLLKDVLSFTLNYPIDFCSGKLERQIYKEYKELSVENKLKIFLDMLDKK